jgi:hypothetical protein
VWGRLAIKRHLHVRRLKDPDTLYPMVWRVYQKFGVNGYFFFLLLSLLLQNFRLAPSNLFSFTFDPCYFILE